MVLGASPRLAEGLNRTCHATGQSGGDQGVSSHPIDAAPDERSQDCIIGADLGIERIVSCQVPSERRGMDACGDADAE